MMNCSVHSEVVSNKKHFLTELYVSCSRTLDYLDSFPHITEGVNTEEKK